jgi:hypothetical protein
MSLPLLLNGNVLPVSTEFTVPDSRSAGTFVSWNSLQFFHSWFPFGLFRFALPLEYDVVEAFGKVPLTMVCRSRSWLWPDFLWRCKYGEWRRFNRPLAF